MRLLISGSWVRAPHWATSFVHYVYPYKLCSQTAEKLLLLIFHMKANAKITVTRTAQMSLK